MGRHHSHRRCARQDRLYRSRKGMILGVCQGLADYFNVSATGIRITAVILFIFTGFWPVGALYLLAAFIFKPRPRETERPSFREDYKEHYDPYAETRGATLSQLKRTSDRLNQRIQSMEDTVISREQDWDRRFNKAVNSSGM